MKLTIGRDQSSQRLRITPEGGAAKIFGNPGSVPMTVSREHCLLELNSDDTYTVTNIKLQNITSVNGLAVQSKQVTPNDVITLGSDNYRLDWQYVKSMFPAVADIRPLEKVWNEYKSRIDKLNRERERFIVIRTSTAGLMALSGLLGILLGRQNTIAIIPAALVFICSLIFFIKAWRDVDKRPKLIAQAENKFQEQYVCPHCKRLLDNYSYKKLSRNYDACPFCKAKFIK